MSLRNRTTEYTLAELAKKTRTSYGFMKWLSNGRAKHVAKQSAVNRQMGITGFAFKTPLIQEYVLDMAMSRAQLTELANEWYDETTADVRERCVDRTRQFFGTIKTYLLHQPVTTTHAWQVIGTLDTLTDKQALQVFDGARDAFNALLVNHPDACNIVLKTMNDIIKKGEQKT